MSSTPPIPASSFCTSPAESFMLALLPPDTVATGAAGGEDWPSARDRSASMAAVRPSRAASRPTALLALTSA